MQEFKGTPGPWFYSGKHEECKVRYVGTSTERDPLTEVAVIFTGEPEEIQANANLIAAAPELLEALQLIIKDLRIRAKVRGDIDDDGTVVLDIGSGVLMKANDAIAKALGQ